MQSSYTEATKKKHPSTQILNPKPQIPNPKPSALSAKPKNLDCGDDFSAAKKPRTVLS